MLPDFPRIKQKWAKVFIKYVKDNVTRASFLSKIKTVPHFEGNRMSTHYSDGEVDRPSYERLSSALSVKDDDLIKMGPQAFIDGLNRTTEELREQQSKLVFERMNEVTQKTGNTVDAKGQPLSHDLLLQTLEKMEIDFDGEGQPLMPTLVVSPTQYEEFKKKIVEWEKDPKCQDNFNKLMESKRKAWNDRESNRKLVD